MKKYLVFIVLAILISSCSSQKISRQDREKVLELKHEILQIDNEIKDAQERLSKFEEGSVAALIESRIEILKTTKALIGKRIAALQAGVNIKYDVKAINPDADKANQLKDELKKVNEKLAKSKIELENYGGGLMGAKKYSQIATREETAALLEQKYLILKYGLAMPIIRKIKEVPEEKSRMEDETEIVRNTSQKTASDISKEIIDVEMIKKYYKEKNYSEYMLFDMKLHAVGLDKPARTIKGILIFEDSLGELQLTVRWTINEPLGPGQTIEMNGSGFLYNKFKDSHVWVKDTDLKDMKVTFKVRDIVYQDGTSREFEIY